MAHEIVKYNNYMNSLTFKGFEQRDFDLLMSICARMRDLGEAKQVFSYDYLMELSGWDKTQKVDIFHEDLKRMVEKLRQVGATIDIDQDEFVSFNLFLTFRGNRKKRQLTVQTNPDFQYILNDLTKGFTRFELREYVGLDGRYAKQLYQQIRQRYRLKGHFWQPTVEELRRALSIPDSYEVRDIVRYVVDPAVMTIRSCKGLADLSVEQIRSKRRGRKIEAFRFTWTELDQIPGQMHLDDIQPPQLPKKRGRPRKAAFEQTGTDYSALEDDLIEK